MRHQTNNFKTLCCVIIISSRQLNQNGIGVRVSNFRLHEPFSEEIRAEMCGVWIFGLLFSLDFKVLTRKRDRKKCQREKKKKTKQLSRAIKIKARKVSSKAG